MNLARKSKTKTAGCRQCVPMILETPSRIALLGESLLKSSASYISIDISTYIQFYTDLIGTTSGEGMNLHSRRTFLTSEVVCHRFFFNFLYI